MADAPITCTKVDGTSATFHREAVATLLRRAAGAPADAEVVFANSHGTVKFDDPTDVATVSWLSEPREEPING